jgi:hypothetical protein
MAIRFLTGQGVTGNITISGTGTFGGNVAITGGFLSITGDGSNAATLTESSIGIFTIAALDDIILDAAGDIALDAGGDDIRFRVNGTTYGTFNNASSNLNIYSSIQDKAIKFLGNDGGTQITSLILNMADGGNATFVSDVGLGGTGLYTALHSLNIDGTGLAIKNDANGSNNNWSSIRNTATASTSNFVFTTGAGISLTLNHDKSAIFTGLVSGITPTAAANFATKAYVDANSGGTVTGTGVATRVAFWSGTSSLSADSNLYWDDTNNRLGIGTASPGQTLSVQGDSTAAAGRFTAGGNTNTLELFGNSTTGQSSGLLVNAGTNTADYAARFRNAAGSVIMNIRGDGNVGIGTTAPNDKLNIHSSSASANLGLKITRGSQTHGLRLGVNDSHAFLWTTENQDLVFATNDSQRVTIQAGGNVGIGATSPFSRLQSGSQTFTGANGMFTNSRVGISNHGNLTGMMLASTYNDATYPEYGLVFVQGPSTSSYNVWSISPDGPARGSGLSFIYKPNTGNIHTGAPAVYLEGSTGHVGIGTTTPRSKFQVGASATIGSGFSVPSAALFAGDSNTTHAQVGVFDNDTFAIDKGGSIDLGGLVGGTGSSPYPFARISGLKENSTSGNYAGYFEISTTPTGSLTDTPRLQINSSGSLKLHNYNSTNLTGTPTYLLGTDASGNVVKTLSTPGGDPGPYLPLAGGTMTGTNGVLFPDGFQLQLGTGNDGQIFHNDASMFVSNNKGDLYIRNSADDKDIIFQSDDGSGGLATYFFVDTASDATQFTKTVYLQDNVKAQFGNSSDLQIFHSGTDSFINDTGTGDLKISGSSILMLKPGLGEFLARFIPDGAVELYHDGSKKFETTSTGVAITGDIVIDSALLSNQENTDIDIGTEVVASVVKTSYDAAFFDFVVKKGTNIRSGTVYACHDGTNVQFTETSTQDLGDTSDLVFNVNILVSNMRLLATAASDNWTVKTLIRAL